MRWTITWLVIACAMGRASAEQFVTGTAFYRMSDRDTDSEAAAIAFQRAMDKACEQAGFFEVTSASHSAATEWGGTARYETFARDTAVRSQARLRLVSKVSAPVEERIRTAAVLGNRTVHIEDQVRYWTCAVRVEVMAPPRHAVSRSEASSQALAGLPARWLRQTEPDVGVSRAQELREGHEAPQRRLPAELSRSPAQPTAERIADHSGHGQRSHMRQSPRDLLFQAGLDHVLRENWFLARDLFGRVLRQDPTCGDALYLLAFCLEKSGDHPSFRRVLSKAVAQHPHKSIYGVLQTRLDGVEQTRLAL